MLTACAGNANSSEDTESVQSEAYSAVDKILLSLVLHEIDDNLADSIIGEAKRVLKDEGEIIITEWERSTDLLKNYYFYQ